MTVFAFASDFNINKVGSDLVSDLLYCPPPPAPEVILPPPEPEIELPVIEPEVEEEEEEEEIPAKR